jgi:CubicO group peptidase (beta-lactamase class C family)
MLRCILAVLLLAATGCAQDISRMDQAVQSFVADKQFMGSVLVARGNQVLFSKGYGFANLEWSTPNTPATKFRIGSMTKQFTAAAILLLEERGKLKIGDPVRKYLPDEPVAWDKVTIYHLLTHTSGIVNLLSVPGIQNMVPLPQTPDQLMAVVRDKPLEFEPGTKYQYSNSGYNLLGRLIEIVTGQRYQSFMDKSIFAPLGMKDSGYDTNIDILPRRAAGYSSGPGGLVNADFVHMSNTYSAGGLYSTTEDLLRWEQGLWSGKLLSPQSLAKMTTPYLNGYAFGLGIGTYRGRKRICHDGGVPGFNSFLAYFPETRITVAVLSNMLPPGAAPEIAGLLSDIAHGEKVVLTSELKAITLSPKTLESLAGTYRIAPGNNMIIDVENGLLISRTGQLTGYVNTTTLTPSSETYFFSKETNVQVEFIKDKEAITRLVLHRYGGDDLKAERTGNGAANLVPVQASKGRIDQYAGVYLLPQGIELVFTVEEDKFVLHRPFQTLQYQAMAESENRFFLKELDEKIEFIKDAGGVISHLILREGTSEIKAPRMAKVSEIDGAWAGEERIYILKAEGNTVTGKVICQSGEGWISEGKMDGPNISFVVKTGQLIFKNKGTLSGDLIQMTQSNGNETTTFTVRRVAPKRATAQ